MQEGLLCLIPEQASSRGEQERRHGGWSHALCQENKGGDLSLKLKEVCPGGREHHFLKGRQLDRDEETLA